MGSVFIVWPSISNVAGKSLIVMDAALKHASAEIENLIPILYYNININLSDAEHTLSKASV